MWKHSIVHLTNTDFTLEKRVIHYIVQFFPRCKFFLPLFRTDYHTLPYPKTKEIKSWSCRCSHTCNSIDSFSSSSESMVSAVGIPFVSGNVMHSRPASSALPPIMAYGRSGCTRRCGKKDNFEKIFFRTANIYPFYVCSSSLCNARSLSWTGTILSSISWRTDN